jgi:hypothetical protein
MVGVEERVVAKIRMGRQIATSDGGFVVFLIGMRVNRWWRVHRWLPVLRAMGPMQRSLLSDPSKGLLGQRFVWLGGPAFLQYWRSPEALERFARSRDDAHQPAWRWYNRTQRAAGVVGIWHETYVVPPGGAESTYVNMPVVGLGAAVGTAPADRASGIPRPPAAAPARPLGRRPGPRPLDAVRPRAQDAEDGRAKP